MFEPVTTVPRVSCKHRIHSKQGNKFIKVMLTAHIQATSLVVARNWVVFVPAPKRSALPSFGSGEKNKAKEREADVTCLAIPG